MPHSQTPVRLNPPILHTCHVDGDACEECRASLRAQAAARQQPAPVALTRCHFHQPPPIPATIAAARDEAVIFLHTSVGEWYAHALSMGGLELGAPCCPAAAHARFLMASAFRQAGNR